MSRRARSDNPAGLRRSEAHLQRAFDLARREHPHPNPRVGAVVVSQQGDIVGEAAHRRAGEPHAEVLALQAAGSRAAGGTMYVTLEPCSHHGRTPPCVDAVIGAGIRHVVVAIGDPDGRVSGTGIAALERAGIEVTADVDPAAGEQLDPGYFHHRRTGRPLVTLKLAATLDGQAAAADGTSQWITGEPARHAAHGLRARSDAVVVGAGTLRTDDPTLDVRIAGYSGRQPRPVIIAGSAPLPSAAQVYARDPLIYRHALMGDEPPSADVVVVGDAGTVDLIAAFKDLGTRGFLDVMVEGGPRLAAGLVAAQLVDRIVVYFGAKLAGGTGFPVFDGAWRTLDDAVDLEIESVATVGGDIVVTAEVVR